MLIVFVVIVTIGTKVIGGLNMFWLCSGFCDFVFELFNERPDRLQPLINAFMYEYSATRPDTTKYSRNQVGLHWCYP